METKLNLFSLPTDNLYKFIAILGLAMMIVTSYYHYTNLEELRTRSGRLLEENRLWEEEYPILKNLKESLQNREDLSKKEQDPYRLDALLKAEIQEWKALNQELDEFAKRGAAIIAKQEALLFLMRSFEKIAQTLAVGFWLGALLSAYGFILWYFRLQKFIDMKNQK